MPEPLPAGAGDEGMATTDPAEAVVAPTPFISPLKSGPLAEDEKADIIRRAPEGQSVDDIAEAIGRRKNVVATVVYQAQKRGNEPEPQPPLPTAAAEPATGAAVSPAPVAHPDASLSPIEVHLHSQPRKGGWTMERDHELLSLICAGWVMPEISAEMKVPAGDLKARFDLLTGLHRDANDKPARRWTRKALLAALTPWVQSQAAE